MSSGVMLGNSVGVGTTQMSLENYEYTNKLNEIQMEMNKSNLTKSQKGVLRKVINTVTKHLTEKDYSGVERDIAGNPIPNGKGGYFDHIHEMQDSYKALIKAKRSLEGSLSNPKLDSKDRNMLESTLKLVKFHIQKINNMFEQYGGIEKWKKR